MKVKFLNTIKTSLQKYFKDNIYDISDDEYNKVKQFVEVIDE